MVKGRHFFTVDKDGRFAGLLGLEKTDKLGLFAFDLGFPSHTLVFVKRTHN